jgi:FkbM family methyltransferase
MINSQEWSPLEKFNLFYALGDWISIVDTDIPQEDMIGEVLCFKLAALYQLGKIEDAKLLIKQNLTMEKEFLQKLLVSGVYNCLAKARYLLGEKSKSDLYFSESISLAPGIINFDQVKNIRVHEQLAQISSSQRWVSFSDGDVGRKKKLFIDCGGHDGCSAIKFLLENPNYDVISFEANPELWSYYERIPTQLHKKAVYDYDGEVEFIIDPVDADGSSLIKEKNIDFYKKIKNEDCPRIIIECIDLSRFVKDIAAEYEEIILKLDVEGAEYAILNKMLNDDTLKYVNKLFAEFHWNKIGMAEEIHFDLLEKVKAITKVEPWDAQEFSVFAKDKSAITRRNVLLSALGS